MLHGCRFSRRLPGRGTCARTFLAKGERSTHRLAAACRLSRDITYPPFKSPRASALGRRGAARRRYRAIDERERERERERVSRNCDQSEKQNEKEEGEGRGRREEKSRILRRGFTFTAAIALADKGPLNDYKASERADVRRRPEPPTEYTRACVQRDIMRAPCATIDACTTCTRPFH